MTVLNYHLERDNRYSLAYIADNKQDVVHWTTEYENRVAVEQETIGNGPSKSSVDLQGR
jgi:hypothetical protein